MEDLNILSFETDINSVLSIGTFDEEEELLISSSDPNDDSYVSFYLDAREVKELYRHLQAQLASINEL